jgi:hypothetical protein
VHLVGFITGNCRDARSHERQMTYFCESTDGPVDVGVSPISIRSCFLILIHNTIMAVVCPSELVGAIAVLVDVQ